MGILGVEIEEASALKKVAMPAFTRAGRPALAEAG